MTDPVILKLLQRSIEQNEQIIADHARIRADLAKHVTTEEQLVKGLLSAFPKKPDGTPDFEGHEMYHAALIEESRERALFLRGLRYKLMEKGFWSLITVLGLLALYWWNGQMRIPH